MSVEGEENQLKFKRIFVIFVQKCFLLPTTVSTISPIHKLSALHVDTVQQWDWASHVLSFLKKVIKAQREGKKLSVDGCVFVLMLIYFHESKFPRLEADNAPGPSWVAYWTRRKLLDRIALEKTNQMGLVNRAELREEKIEEKKVEKKTVFLKGKKKEKEKKEKKKIVILDLSLEEDNFSRSEEEEIEKTLPKKRIQPLRLAKKQTKIKKIVLTDSESKTESEDELPTVNLDSEPMLQTQTSSAPSVNAPNNTNSTTPGPQLQIIAVREETRSQPLDIVSVAVALPSSLVEEIINDQKAFTYIRSKTQIEEVSVNDCPSGLQHQEGSNSEAKDELGLIKRSGLREAKDEKEEQKIGKIEKQGRKQIKKKFVIEDFSETETGSDYEYD
ncbi:hypothetical protein Ahy_Scaffold5g107755 [Arachis hypogaea]|uniref:Uncharacterized protein n=1 Tax=Arachis hypogaea TaxID=3818 RepID=A0A444WQ36_ARAHY|nr:hypothetical protein Ahy_Scaffold5g107755 [Arachis hypogaea]